MRRREFVGLMAAAGAATLAGCTPGVLVEQDPRRVLLLAFDGLDPRLVDRLMSAGRLPNFAQLAARGSLAPLATTTPPHTPVAFATVITGTDPAQHQIFDFIHRDPNPTAPSLAVRPYFSTSEALPANSGVSLPVGNWQLPLAGDANLLLRRGRPFWEHLTQAGIDVRVYFVPSNYPCQQSPGRGKLQAISGMGTPDLLGTHGEFTFFSSRCAAPRAVSGGRFLPIELRGDRGEASLPGPHDPFQPVVAAPALQLPLRIVRDAVRDVALVQLAGCEVLLNAGGWSDWLPLDFTSRLPGAGLLGSFGAATSLRGMVRLLLAQVRPHFELYVSPINLDPAAPTAPLSVPPVFATELAQRHGRFYTQGIPEDTKALSHGALSAAMFLDQAALVAQERAAQWRAALAEFEAGCLFFYFGASDLLQHMFWRDQDPQHPGHDPSEAAEFGQVVAEQYEQADLRLGEALAALDERDTLLVFSDHGFTSFRRGFQLNSWLGEEGYLRLADPSVRHTSAAGVSSLLTGADWNYTRAYGLGMNALYINLAGREKHGSVSRKHYRPLIEEIRERLLAVRDRDGAAIIDQVELTAEIYPDADERLAPDLIVGYADGFRASWDTVLGGAPQGELIADNLERWSGTHLISACQVPGMLLTNRAIALSDPHLRDLAPTVLAALGITQPAEMTGRNLFG